MTLETYLLGISDRPQKWAHPSKKLPNGSGGRETGEGSWLGRVGPGAFQRLLKFQRPSLASPPPRKA